MLHQFDIVFDAEEQENTVQMQVKLMHSDKKEVPLEEKKFKNCVFELLINENDDEVVCILVK
jgi:hypothetical protein